MASKAEASFSRKVVAEFVGTAALVVCGPGTAAATGVIAKAAGVAFSMAQLGVIAMAFLMVIIAMIYTIGHISGCHINPAVTLALAAARKTAWTDVPGYLAAQFTGAIAGAFAIWAILEQPGLDAGLGVLSYHPGHTRAAFCAELIGTFLLVLVVFGTTTDGRATPGWYGLAIPAIVFAVITVVGPVTGAALNPARYIGPMIARAALGGGKGLLWNQVPVYFIATFAAGLVAAATYAFLRSVGPALGAADAVSAVQFGVALQAALTGIQELGAAVVGDKTMVDAWYPAVTAYQAVINTGGDLREATGAAAEAAARGLRATATMQARKGRASYIGARTVGHEDPGAASTVLVVRALATTIAGTAGLTPAGAV